MNMTEAVQDQTAMMPETPVVSVVITSYNSEKWIGKAIQSVLDQQTTFPIEIVISDDCSKDGTVAVATSYQEEHPQIIRVLARTANVGTQRNYYDAFEQSRGTFIAWLDADDYWTDPMKLAIQVEAMQADPTIMVCGHYVRWVTRGDEAEVQRERVPPLLAPGRHGLKSILKSNFLPSPSVMFRSGLQRKLPQWYFDVPPLTDWPLYVVAACSGDILLIDRVMADYTLNETSAFWGAGSLFWYKMDAGFYDRVEEIIPREFHRLARFERSKRYQEIAYALRKSGDYVGSRRAAVTAFMAPAITDNLGGKTKTLLASLVRETQWRLSGSNANQV
jgi:glycosyltransferase involved in cell wall biosynthesis